VYRAKHIFNARTRKRLKRLEISGPDESRSCKVVIVTEDFVQVFVEFFPFSRSLVEWASP
jgi:hypothetical protein